MSAASILDSDAVQEARDTFRAKFATMSGYYFEDAEGYLDTLRAAVVQQDVAALVAPAHTLKSSSRQMGAALVSSIARDVEATARQQVEQGAPQIAVFAELMARLEAAFSETRDVYPKA